MKLSLAYYGDAILRKKAAQIEMINDEIRELVENMIDTMIATKGIGLAAPQVNHSLALFIACFIDSDTDSDMDDDSDQEIERSKIKVFINPKIDNYSQKMTKYSEGCLSIPRLYKDIERPFKVTITALDLEGNVFTEEFDDFNAHIVLHENDHLNGVLFIDRLSIKERKLIEPHLREIKKKFSKNA